MLEDSAGQHVAGLRQLVRRWTQAWCADQGVTLKAGQYGMAQVAAHLGWDEQMVKRCYELSNPRRVFSFTETVWADVQRLAAVVPAPQRQMALAKAAGYWAAACRQRPFQYTGRLWLPDDSWQRVLSVTDVQPDMRIDLKAVLLDGAYQAVVARLARAEARLAGQRAQRHRSDVSRQQRRARDKTQLARLREDLTVLRTVVAEQDRVLADYRLQLEQAEEALARADTAAEHQHRQHAAELAEMVEQLAALERRHTEVLHQHAAALTDLRSEHDIIVQRLQRHRDAAYASATASDAERRQERQLRQDAEQQAAAERARRDQAAAERDDLRRQLEVERPPTLPNGGEPATVGAYLSPTELFTTDSGGPEPADETADVPAAPRASTGQPTRRIRLRAPGCRWLTSSYGLPGGLGRALRAGDRKLASPADRQRAAIYEIDIRTCIDPQQHLELVQQHAAVSRGMSGPQMHVHYVRLRGTGRLVKSLCACPLRWCVSCRWQRVRFANSSAGPAPASAARKSTAESST